MKKQLIIVGIIFLLVAVGLSGCTSLSSEEKKFLGTWKTDNSFSFTIFTFVFKDNKECITNSDIIETGNWKVENNRLIITFKVDLGNGQINTYQDVYYYQFSNNNQNLKISPYESYIGLQTFYLTKT